MKYTEYIKERAKELFKKGILTKDQYTGMSMAGFHICWYVCADERNDWWKCEECGEWDPDRAPYNLK